MAGVNYGILSLAEELLHMSNFMKMNCIWEDYVDYRRYQDATYVTQPNECKEYEEKCDEDLDKI
jgi:hypothetical protein